MSEKSADAAVAAKIRLLAELYDAPASKVSNSLPLLTIIIHDVVRFARSPFLTILGPAVPPLIVGAVVTTTHGGSGGVGADLALGMIIIASVLGAFGNSASALLFWKATRSLPHILCAPIEPSMVVLGLAFAAMVRSFAIWAFGVLLLSLEIRVSAADLIRMTPMLLDLGLFYGMLGTLAGILCRDNPAANAITSMILYPFNMLVLIFIVGTKNHSINFPEVVKGGVEHLANIAHMEIFKIAIISLASLALFRVSASLMARQRD